MNAQPQAAAYLAYFDATTARVTAAVADIPPARRIKVLYCNVKAMSQPHLIADSWIQSAGGVSVTAGTHLSESVAFSLEHVFLWNPQVIIVTTPSEMDQIYHDPRWSTIAAVRSKRVYAAPIGAHSWGNRTAEQPLAILWAAKRFYPERFGTLDLDVAVEQFYQQFFSITLSRPEIAEILSGIP